MNRLIVLLGATAVGKSEAAMWLAERFSCEIVSGDSMCVYRGLDIGTAKPTAEDRRRIPHHLIDILNPEEPFSVVDFQRLATEAIADINRRGRIPLLVGGTGLYVQALLEGYRFNSTPKTDQREALLAETGPDGDAAGLHLRLQKLDPQAAERIHPHDQRRIVRALEVLTIENQSLSREKNAKLSAILFDGPVFALERKREDLYRRIDARVDAMLAAGLVSEVGRLLAMGIPAQATAMQAIGYKEMVAHLRGGLPIDAAVELIKQSSRRYAKRQMTWFRRMPYIRWLNADDPQAFAASLDEMARQVAEKYSIG